MKLIGFSGAMGSGKSTAVEVLKDLTAKDIKLVKFAGPLYDIQEYIYRRISPVVTRNASFTKDRKLLQWVGTEWGRDTISKTLWLDLWKQDVEKSLSLHQLVVCDDVRYDNEAKLVREMGGIVIQVTSTTDRGAAKGISNHSSEDGLPYKLVDYQIRNNGSLEDYRNSLGKLYSMLGLSTNTQSD